MEGDVFAFEGVDAPRVVCLASGGEERPGGGLLTVQLPSLKHPLTGLESSIIGETRLLILLFRIVELAVNETSEDRRRTVPELELR